ncbi:hypothetical protein DMN57_18760 [Escherichia coli]|nr:hypothetical protein [Escherichia coli]
MGLFYAIIHFYELESGFVHSIIIVAAVQNESKSNITGRIVGLLWHKQQNKHCTVYSFQRVNTRSNVARN